MLSKEAIQEFKELYKKVFYEELTDTEATCRANYVLDFYKAVYLPEDE